MVTKVLRYTDSKRMCSQRRDKGRDEEESETGRLDRRARRPCRECGERSARQLRSCARNRA
eukprot:3454798-Pleurochrysis_carterae.AAC.1